LSVWVITLIGGWNSWFGKEALLLGWKKKSHVLISITDDRSKWCHCVLSFVQSHRRFGMFIEHSDGITRELLWNVNSSLWSRKSQIQLKGRTKNHKRREIRGPRSVVLYATYASRRIEPYGDGDDLVQQLISP